MKSLKTTMQKISLSDKAKEKMTENVKGAGRASAGENNRRIIGIVSAAAVFCFIALGAVFVSGMHDKPESISEKRISTFKSEDSDLENTSRIHADTKAENDTSDNSIGYLSENYERIMPKFTPSKRIKGNVEDVYKQYVREEEETVRNRILVKYGIPIDTDISEMSEKQKINYYNEFTFYFDDRYNALLQKMVENGYCEEKVIHFCDDAEPLIDGTVSFISDRYIIGYCNFITTICNAYNDPDYEISDTDRIILLQVMESSICSFYEYTAKHKNKNIPFEVAETLEYEKQTFAADTEEYGQRFLKELSGIVFSVKTKPETSVEESSAAEPGFEVSDTVQSNVVENESEQISNEESSAAELGFEESDVVQSSVIETESEQKSNEELSTVEDQPHTLSTSLS